MFKIFKKKESVVYAPISGSIVKIEDIPDPVFSQRMMGDGIAIQPEGNTIVSPIEGVIEAVFPTKHALTITGKNGVSILIHVGIDTVSLGGEGFETIVEQGEKIKVGAPLLKVDFEYIRSREKSDIVIVLFPELEKELSFIDGSKVSEKSVLAKVIG